MNQRSICINLLTDHGYILKRRGSNHDIYYNPETKHMVPVKRHDFNENDLRYILKETHIKR